MILTTTDNINGKELEMLGLVKGSTILTVNAFRDIGAGLKTLVGGELTKYNEMLNDIKHFNYEHIIFNKRFDAYKVYVSTVIRAVYDTLIGAYDGGATIGSLLKMQSCYPKLITDFTDLLYRNVSADMLGSKAGELRRYRNEKIYGSLETREIYVQAIIDYISGMTDRYAVEVYNELLKY